MKQAIVTLFFLIANTMAFACFWDYDTIEMERRQFPSVIELISGKFLRHSPEFHYWRIKDREQKIRKFADSLNLYDDLAVSYSKIGKHKKAINIILKKDSITPRLYKTYANLGTFYIHDGDFKKGIEYIDKAIKINPKAHFGREIYQRHLAEYILGKMKNGKIALPLSNTFGEYQEDLIDLEESNNFYSFLAKKNTDKLEGALFGKKLPYKIVKEAIIGVMGMMKFGNYNSPILLEALGDLLMGAGLKNGARQLASRAYFKASYAVKDKKTKTIYKKRILATLYHQYTKKHGKKISIYELEELLKEEIEDGNQFYQKIRNDEIYWINSGKNPEKEFDLKYYKEPKTPKRIQHGNGKKEAIEEKLYNEILVDTVIDYRPIPIQNIIIDSLQKNSIDSLFKYQLKKEEIITKPHDSTKQKKRIIKKGNDFLILKIVLVVIGIIVMVLWYIKRKNN